jgi:hypothetical protein
MEQESHSVISITYDIFAEMGSSLSPFSLFCLFANEQLSCVSSSTNGQMTNFHLHNEQMVKGLRKIACASSFHLKW